MRARRPLLIFLACLVAVGATLFAAGSLITASLVKLSITRAARQQGLTVTFGSIDAPLFRPVVVRNVRIGSGTATGTNLDISRATLHLRLRALVDRSRGRWLRNLSITGLRGVIASRAATPTSSGSHWPFLEQIVADNFEVSSPALILRAGSTTIDIRDAAISGNEIEPGTFRVAHLSINSPFFIKTFDNLRGGTSWNLNRLTIGGVTLMRGLDCELVAIDLARIGAGDIAIDANIDAFGGSIRTSMSTDLESGHRVWDIAASATEVSLGELSDALAFATRASGSIHACKATFRGSFYRLIDATASLWAEVTGFTWRDRTADVAMLGASLYDRQIQIQQLYVKQRANALTVSGEFDLPRRRTDRPDFRGDVSASIADLGDFVRLFGGSAANFGGRVAVNGAIRESGKALAGQIVASGEALTLFGEPFDALDARIVLDGSATRVEKFELRRAADPAGSLAMAFHGAIDLPHNEVAALRLTSDQRFTISAPADCVTGIDLTASPGGADQQLFDQLELRGSLQSTSWTIRIANSSEPAIAPRSFTFCNDGTGSGPLRLSPASK